MKVRIPKTGSTGTASEFNTHALCEVFVNFDGDGGADSMFSKDVEVHLSAVGRYSTRQLSPTFWRTQNRRAERARLPVIFSDLNNRPGDWQANLCLNFSEACRQVKKGGVTYSAGEFGTFVFYKYADRGDGAPEIFALSRRIVSGNAVCQTTTFTIQKLHGEFCYALRWVQIGSMGIAFDDLRKKHARFRAILEQSPDSPLKSKLIAEL